jgi:hypothetical protein
MKPARNKAFSVAQIFNLLYRRVALSKAGNHARRNERPRRSTIKSHRLCLVFSLIALGTPLVLHAENQETSPASQQGSPLDISAWAYRKPVTITRPGVQQLEMDPEVLSRAQPAFADLRLLHEGNQISYVLERTTLQRALTPQVTATNDAHNPRVGRWIIKLPQPNLPVSRLTCSAKTSLFQRELTAYENVRDERGGTFQHVLGRGSWTRTSSWWKKDFSLAFDGPPQSDTIILETDNGDNRPIELENFQLFYPATRILFKANSGDKLFLYYGNPSVNSPRYDLSLVAGDLLAASKSDASLGGEEQMKKSWQSELEKAGKGGVVFWAVLGLVVAALLLVIAKLLPKSGTTNTDQSTG